MKLSQFRRIEKQAIKSRDHFKAAIERHDKSGNVIGYNIEYEKLNNLTSTMQDLQKSSYVTKQRPKTS